MPSSMPGAPGIRSGLQAQEETVRHRIPGIVWLLIAGDGFASAFRFMVMPFLALYMHAVTGATPAVVGIVIGLGAASNLVASFLLGPLSDRIGRKPSLIWGTVLQVLALAGFAVAHSLVFFAALQVLSGMVWALQGPAYMALLTDLTPESYRTRMFGFNYWAVNIGAAIGPLVGSLIGAGHAALPFLLAAASQVVLAFALLAFIPSVSGERPSGVTSLESLRHMGQGLRHHVLLWAFVGTFLTSLAYSQIETNLAQYLGLHYAHGAQLFAYLIAANAITVVLLQPFLSRWQEGRPLLLGFAGGAAICAVANALFILAVAPWAWIGINAFFTVGEVLLAPVGQAVIARYAPPDQRATYFALQNIVFGLAFAIGPSLGGLALVAEGKLGLFGSMAAVNLLALGAFLVAFAPSRETHAPAV